MEKWKQHLFCLRENICAFPDHLANFMRDATSLLATSLSYLVVLYIWSICFQNGLSPGE